MMHEQHFLFLCDNSSASLIQMVYTYLINPSACANKQQHTRDRAKDRLDDNKTYLKKKTKNACILLV